MHLPLLLFLLLNFLGYFLQNGYGCTKDLKEAKIWFEKAAEKGYKEAQYQLGILLQEDKSDEQVFKKNGENSDEQGEGGG
jgi:TPR repeat protein